MFTCLCAYAHVCLVFTEVRRRCQIPCKRSYDCELLCGCWKSNQGSLLLTTKSFLQSQLLCSCPQDSGISWLCFSHSWGRFVMVAVTDQPEWSVHIWDSVSS